MLQSLQPKPKINLLHLELSPQLIQHQYIHKDQLIPMIKIKFREEEEEKKKKENKFALFFFTSLSKYPKKS